MGCCLMMGSSAYAKDMMLKGKQTKGTGPMNNARRNLLQSLLLRERLKAIVFGVQSHQIIVKLTLSYAVVTISQVWWDIDFNQELIRFCQMLVAVWQ